MLARRGDDGHLGRYISSKTLYTEGSSLFDQRNEVTGALVVTTLNIVLVVLFHIPFFLLVNGRPNGYTKRRS